jgi:hypothetical protein
VTGGLVLTNAAGVRGSVRIVGDQVAAVGADNIRDPFNPLGRTDPPDRIVIRGSRIAARTSITREFPEPAQARYQPR